MEASEALDPGKPQTKAVAEAGAEESTPGAAELSEQGMKKSVDPAKSDPNASTGTGAPNTQQCKVSCVEDTTTSTSSGGRKRRGKKSRKSRKGKKPRKGKKSRKNKRTKRR